MAEDTPGTVDPGTTAPGGSPEPTALSAAVSAASDWRQGLPEDLRAEKSLADFKDVPALAKSYVEGAKLRGRSIPLPPEGATPEVLAKWKADNLPKLAGLTPAAPSVPVSPDKYVIKPHDNPHIPQFNDQRTSFYKEQFHKAGMTQEQVDAVTKAYIEDFTTLTKWADDSNLAQIESLRQTWGDTVFDARKVAAERGLETVAKRMGMDGNKVREYMDKTLKGNDPILFQLFAGVGEAISEDTAIGVGSSTSTGSAGSVTEKGNEIRSEMAKVSPGGPKWTELNAQLEALYKGAQR